MSFFAAGVSFRTAPLALREQLAVAPSDQAAVGQRLMETGGLTEAVLLWTCNRVEIYGVAESLNGNIEAMFRRLTPHPLTLGSQIFLHEGAAAVHHLFCVASGLDSMVLGETEITGQVKSAYEKARMAGHTAKRLNRVFQKALETAKLVRTRTAIGKGAASVGSVAVQHARKIFGSDLTGKRVMVIGAGNMAEKCLRHLVKRGAPSLVVVNRSWDKAEELAVLFGGRAVPFGRCLDEMADVDMVITSTGCPHIILERHELESVMAGRPDRPLVIIDIAVPRDVAADARTIPGVHLHDIGDLEDTVREAIRFREQDLAQAWAIIGVQASELESHLEIKGTRIRTETAVDGKALLEHTSNR